jgi:hypothetical protein
LQLEAAKHPLDTLSRRPAMIGRPIPLPPGRRFIADLSWMAQRVPQGYVRRVIRMDGAQAARALARRSGGPSTPWTIIFARAYGLAAQELPHLRRVFAALPRQHIYEAQGSVATIMVERDWGGEASLFPAMLRNPEERSLAELAADLADALHAPIERHGQFGAMVRVNALPQPLRRLLWWYAFNVGEHRLAHFGTFAISVLGHRGISTNFTVSPVTTALTLAPFKADGSVELTVSFDHRALDGAAVADGVDLLETMLNGKVAEELRAAADLPRPAPAQEAVP